MRSAGSSARPLAGLVAVAALLASCGGQADDAPRPETPSAAGAGQRLADERYRIAMNRFCASLKDESAALAADAASFGSREAYLAEGIRLIRRANREFAAVRPPARFRAWHEWAVADNTRGLRATEAFARSIRGVSDPATIVRATRKLEARRRRSALHSNALTRPLGLDECVVPVPSAS